MKKKFLIVAILIAVLGFGSLASAAVTAPNLWKIVSGAISPVVSSWELGSATNRIQKGWFNNLDASSATIGSIAVSGTVSGDMVVGGQVRASNGTSTAPSYSFNSDTNTGMLWGGNDIIKFNNAGTTTLTIAANGQPKFGFLASSTANLVMSDTLGNLYSTADNRITSASSPLVLAANSLSINKASSTANGYLSSTDWTSFNGKVSSQWATNGSNISYVAGSVGIGTTNPVFYKLNVAGRIFSTSTSLSVNQDSVAAEDSTSNLLFRSGATNLSNLSVYSNCSKTYLGNGKWRFVNNGSASTLVRFFTNLSDLTNGETYAVGINYENLTNGKITIDWNDSVTTGVVVANSASSTSGRVYGTSSRAVYDTTYHFFDVQLDVNASVDLYGEQVEYKNYPTSFVPGDRGVGDLILGGRLQSYATSSSYFSGNLGIGTTNPTARLYISGTDMPSSSFILQNTVANSYIQNQLTTGSNTTFMYNFGQTYGTPGGFYNQDSSMIYTSGAGGIALVAGNTNGYLRFFTGGASNAYERLRITSSGNVGIGTTGPTEKLEVNGNIKATGYKSSDGTIGTSTTINVRKADDSGACTITVKNGLVTATTCP